jgi:neutral trehalase
MRQTAKGMVENLLGLVQQFGFVPNGRYEAYAKN